MQPRLRIHATDVLRSMKQMLASLGMPASLSMTIPSARAMERSWTFGLHSTALETVLSTIGLCSNPAARLDFDSNVI